MALQPGEAFCDECEKRRFCVVIGETKFCAECALWEAATKHWYETDEETGGPIPLGDLLFESSAALPGIPIKGKDLYRIGCDLGLIEEGER